jgi:hypothetical protein
MGPSTVSQQNNSTKINEQDSNSVNENDKLLGEMDQSYKPKKDLKLASNIYSIAYCTFMKSNKDKFRLKSSDQVDVFYKAMFMFMIQATFIINVLMFDKFDFGFNDDVLLNFCQLFAVLMLHWSSIGDVRSGIYMMKYVVCCPDEFNQPVTCFLIGFLQTNILIFLQICNLLKNYQQKTAFNIMSKVASFGLLASIPKMLAGSMETFEVSKSVGTLKLTRSRKKIQEFGNED